MRFLTSWSIVWRSNIKQYYSLWGQEVPGSSPGCVGLSLGPWERLFTCNI